MAPCVRFTRGEVRNPNPAPSRVGEGCDNAQEISELSQGQNFTGVCLGAGGLCREEPDLLPRVSNRDMSHSLENQCQQDLLENLMLHRKDFGVSAAKEGM